MRVIRLNDRHADVKRWQHFLIGQGFVPGPADGHFGQRTLDATIAFQTKHGMDPDGVVGNKTVGQAMLLGLGVLTDTRTDSSTASWPELPGFRPLTSNAQRAAAWGSFDFVHAPTAADGDAIRILGDWTRTNITTIIVPQLAGIRGAPGTGKIQFHNKGGDRLRAVWQEWGDRDLLRCVESWDGGFVPRFQRGSRKALSNHAFGTAFDINAKWNALGALPALMGTKGCVRELVESANHHGFYWGGHFKNRPDGMHFELAPDGMN
ncbi:hypothetical protein BH23GEM9_BH23GEM9_32110 [soil metagenome]